MLSLFGFRRSYKVGGGGEETRSYRLAVLVVLNKLVKTFGKKSNFKFGLIQTRQLYQVLKHFAKSLTFCID
jgi:hypothetical protein